MLNIAFIAPPAAGKGVQAELLKDKYKLFSLAPGTLLRAEVKKETVLGKKVKLIIEQGCLVNDDIVLKLIEQQLKEKVLNKGYILDGFPRTLEQAKRFTELTQGTSKQLTYVFYLNIDQETACKRISGRLICPQCQKIYNKYFDQFKTPYLCNECESPLQERTDDKEETLRVRFKEYLIKSVPLIKYYQEQGILVEIDGKQEINTVFTEIKNIIERI